MVIVRERYLGAAVSEIAWAANKMAFVSGPRQCGKTTLAKLKHAERAAGRYANWDDVEVRQTWVRAPKELARFANSPVGFQAFLPRIGCDRFVQIVAAPTVRKRLTAPSSSHGP